MTGERLRVVPKRFTNRFSLKNKGKRRGMTLQELGTSYAKPGSRLKSVQVVFFTDLPQVPHPSDELRVILDKFCGEDMFLDACGKILTDTHKKLGRKCKPRKNKRINGFMAFRSFYCRSIFNVEHQRQLSTLLGNVWKNEPNKAVWNRYAIEYNTQLPDADFVDWLCTSLGFGVGDSTDSATSVVKNDSWQFSSTNSTNAVEDIYFLGADSVQ